jgi:sulfur carrier protein ThiS adenylyltransferase
VNVAIVGCGVRGALVAGLLTSAGVEELSLIDGALVEAGDLGAHPLQFTPDLHAPKPDALAAKLGLIDSAVHAQPFPAFVSAENVDAILLGADAVVECINDPEVSALIAASTAAAEVPLAATPTDFEAASANVAEAAEVAATQARFVLDLRVHS